MVLLVGWLRCRSDTGHEQVGQLRLAEQSWLMTRMGWQQFLVCNRACALQKGERTSCAAGHGCRPQGVQHRSRQSDTGSGMLRCHLASQDRAELCIALASVAIRLGHEHEICQEGAGVVDTCPSQDEADALAPALPSLCLHSPQQLLVSCDILCSIACKAGLTCTMRLPRAGTREKAAVPALACSSQRLQGTTCESPAEGC